MFTCLAVFNEPVNFHLQKKKHLERPKEFPVSGKETLRYYDLTALFHIEKKYSQNKTGAFNSHPVEST